MVAYERVLDDCRGRRVIDVGCGEGYGPAILGEAAESVVGIDIAPEVVEHARKVYGSASVSFEVMDVNDLAVNDASFDVAVSFQVVEHLVDESRYFSELARVLRPGGTAYLTTPNRLTISPGRDEPINPFHLREYTPGELARALEEYFATAEVEGMFHAGWLALNDRVHLVDFIKFYEMGKANPRYWSHKLLTPLVSTKDFRIGGGDLSRCLDMFATCTTAGREG